MDPTGHKAQCDKDAYKAAYDNAIEQGYDVATAKSVGRNAEKNHKVDRFEEKNAQNQPESPQAKQGVLELVGNGIWKSTEGLIYGQGSKQGNRVLHVIEHAIPDPTKLLHTVFNTPRDKILTVIDEAWTMKASVTPLLQNNGNQVYNIPMGKVVGVNGETSVRIVVKNGTSEIITSFPIN